MEESFFVRIACEDRCKGHEAAQHIRQATRFPTRASGGGVVNGDVLPTEARLRGCLSDVPKILGFLRCLCPSCGPTTRITPDDHDQKLAQAIANPQKDGLRRCFTVLAFAGCHFSFRTWDRYSTGGQLASFLEKLLRPSGVEDRERLFAPFWQRDRTGPSIDELAQAFNRCIRQQWWVTDIPTFDSSGRSKRLEDCNLPFTYIAPIASTGVRPGKVFRKVEIDHAYCDSDELKKPLFLKRLSFQHSNALAKEDARREIENLLEMKRLGVDCAELLSTFTTLDDTHQHEHLLFHLYDYDLEQILHSRTIESLPKVYQRLASSNAMDLPLSKHPLWESALALLTTMAVLHNPPARAAGLPDGQILQAAHLDLKPANIVMDRFGRLLLIDLEHAVLHIRTRDQTSRFEGRAGTPNFRPPEADDPRVTTFRRSYDLWCLGCVLLEVMVVLVRTNVGGGDDVESFREARYAEISSGEQSSAFWKRTADGYALKDAVHRKIEAMEQHFGPRAARQIRKMMAINERDRPRSMQDCLDEFTSQGDLDELTFIRREEKPIMAARLSKMKVSFTTERQTSPYNCEIQLFKSFVGIPDNRSMTLVIVCGDRDRRMFVPSSAPINALTFVPISYFEPYAILTDNSRPVSDLRCCVRGLHDGTVLHFQMAKDLRLFQTLMTYQQPCSVKGGNGLGIKFNSCELKFRSFRSETHLYGPGHAQVLYRLSEAQYGEELTKESGATLSPGGHRNHSTHTSISSLEPKRTRSTGNGSFSTTSTQLDSLPSSLSRYRLALYTTSLTPPLQCACIVFNLDRQDCIPETNSGSENVIFRGSFLAAIFEPTPGSWSGAAAADAGYPVTPELLDKATSDTEAKVGRTVKLKALTLTMPRQQERDELMAIIKDKIRDTP